MKLRELEPPLRTPMQPRKVDKLPVGSGWVYEPKLDGDRCIAVLETEGVTLYSKSLRGHNDYPPIVEQLKAINHEVILDGEIVFMQQIEDERNLGHHMEVPSLRGLRRYSSKWYERGDNMLRYYIWDALYVDEQDVRYKPLRERRVVLLDVIPDLTQVKVIDQYDEDDIEEAVKDLRLEGVVAKRSDSIYVNGLSWNWQKLKFY